MSFRVLHIIESLDYGAVEGWLVRMLQHARKTGVNVEWTFYCVLGRSGSMDSKVRALGARVIHSPVPPKRKLAFIRALRSKLRSEKYDALHCHHDLMSAVYLLAAIGLPIHRRIVHVHNADENLPTPGRIKQKVLRPLMRLVCLELADRIVGISNHTLDMFLAGHVRRSGRDVVHYYGVDSTPFMNMAADRKQFRRHLGLSHDALILLFAGRVVPEKNPVFTIDVLADLHRLEPRVVCVFAGKGPLESAVLGRARELGVQDSLRMLGWRDDLPEIMSCSDWFILPHPEHPKEGFGLAVVEAQLAGMRMILSNGVADDPLLPTANFKRLSFTGGPQAWAKAAMELLQSPNSLSKDVLAALKESPMDMDYALNALLGLYA